MQLRRSTITARGAHDIARNSVVSKYLAKPKSAQPEAEAALSSTTPTKFHYFPVLPCELRHMIWTWAFLAPRVLSIHHQQSFTEDDPKRRYYFPYTIGASCHEAERILTALHAKYAVETYQHVELHNLRGAPDQAREIKEYFLDIGTVIWFVRAYKVEDLIKSSYIRRDEYWTEGMGPWKIAHEEMASDHALSNRHMALHVGDWQARGFVGWGAILRLCGRLAKVYPSLVTIVLVFKHQASVKCDDETAKLAVERADGWSEHSVPLKECGDVAAWLPHRQDWAIYGVSEKTSKMIRFCQYLDTGEPLKSARKERKKWLRMRRLQEGGLLNAPI